MKDGVKVLKINKSGKPRKIGSGRKPGSYSFVKLKIADIVAKFADHETEVPVSRLWAEQVGFKGVFSTEAKAMFDEIEGQEAAAKVEIKEVEFD